MRGAYSPLYRGNNILRKVGRNAQAWRKSYTDYTQKDIAEMLHISAHVVSLFENGNTNNALILYTYIELGFNPKENYMMYYE